MKTLVLVTNIPTPYRVPLFNELSKVLREKEVVLHVIFGGRTYARRKWSINAESFDFSYEFLVSSDLGINSGETASFDYKGLFRRLYRKDPDWIVFGGYGISAIKSIGYGLLFSTPRYLWSGEIFNDNRKVGFLRNVYRRIIVALSSGGIAYGSKAKEYLCGIGFKKDAVDIAVNTVDVDFFLDFTKSPAGKTLLYVGNLEPLKRVDHIITLAEQLNAIGGGICIDIVGTGSQESELKRMVTRKGLEKVVRFHGFVQKQQLPQYYSQSDLFLFPSEYDIWGLVMLESLASGTPVLSSKYPGAATELIVEGKTGYVVNFSDPVRLATQVFGLLEDQVEMKRMSSACREHVRKNVSLRKSAYGFINALGFKE